MSPFDDLLAPPTRLALLPSVTVVYGLALLVPVVAAVLAFAQARRMARRARHARDDFATKAAPVAGHAALVGVVETEDAAPAVELSIRQVGSEYTSRGARRARWTEVDRTVDARRFHLVLDSGERVRVRPTAAVRLCDDLDGTRGEGHGRRVRTATIEHGARIHAVGVLRRERDATGDGAGYRGGGTSWVLAARGRERLLLSTRSFEHLFRVQARFSAMVGVFVALAVVVTQLAFASFHDLNLFGRVAQAENLRASRYSTTSKSGNVWHYVVHGTIGAPGAELEVEDESTRPVYEAVSDETLVRVPFLVARARPADVQIGREPGISSGGALAVVYAFVAGVVAFWLVRRRSTLWWDRRRVTETGTAPARGRGRGRPGARA